MRVRWEGQVRKRIAIVHKREEALQRYAQAAWDNATSSLRDSRGAVIFRVDEGQIVRVQ